jgi:hypothetical protein
LAAYHQSMRERIFAIVCGALTLYLVFAMIAVSLAGIVDEHLPRIGALVIAAIMLATSGGMFGLAIRRGADDDDLFEGNRGLAVALTIVVIVSVVGVGVVMYVQPDFWRGLLDH